MILLYSKISSTSNRLASLTPVSTTFLVSFEKNKYKKYHIPMVIIVDKRNDFMENVNFPVLGCSLYIKDLVVISMNDVSKNTINI